MAKQADIDKWTAIVQDKNKTLAARQAAALNLRNAYPENSENRKIGRAHV